ncbi:MAG TPA: hypothetical protein VEY30_04090 [Myxococcaceae bacterium]|nr:hypothetical protein [Myxococcaceae bacterium]
MKWLLGCLVAAALGSAGKAAAQERSPVQGQGWSATSGGTVGDKQAVLLLNGGWPGISATALYGFRPDIDLGVRASLNYGFEGLVNAELAAGIRAQGVARKRLLTSGNLTLGAEASPGLLFYFPEPGFTLTGITLPLVANAGVQVSSALLLNFSVSLPMYVTFGVLGGFTFPILAGAGAEYFLTQTTAITVNTRAGPSLSTESGQAGFAFELLVGAAFKL